MAACAEIRSTTKVTKITELAEALAKRGDAVASSREPVLLEGRDCDELAAFLDERIYEFNARATGSFDARSLGLVIRGLDGETIAGLSGHSWGECCFVSYLWVKESFRAGGLGRSAEAEARRRGCKNIVLSTHSFQAPGFYERTGFTRRAVVPDHPVGHENVWFEKKL